MDFPNSYERDYNKYKDFVKDRKFLFEDDSFSDLEKIYIKLYTVSELLSTLESIDRKSMINDFSRELKNSLMISFDLLNMNYLNSSKQIVRSAIESFFRLSLSISRYTEYQDNLSNGIYGSTDSLKRLKSLYTGQSVYKLTSGTLEYFEEAQILYCLEVLNQHYTDLSGNVHVNDYSNFSPQKYLEDYSKFDNDIIEKFISLFLSILNCIATCLLFLLKSLQVIINKRQIQIIEFGIETKLLEIIDSMFYAE